MSTDEFTTVRDLMEFLRTCDPGSKLVRCARSGLGSYEYIKIINKVQNANVTTTYPANEHVCGESVLIW